MKKLFGLLAAAVLLLSLSACAPNPKDVRADIVDMALDFGSNARAEDTDWSSGSPELYGSGSFIIADPESTITLMCVEDGAMAQVQMYVDSVNARTIDLWSIDFGYVKDADRTYISAEYYLASMDPITFDVRYDDLIEQLESLKLSDIVWMIEELGYNVR